ncbi:hypothetical protein GCM10009868_31210 [Terrabacter aerolatus]|uniref:Uncharacterized protein n=1 Tax=Terrabacter aerolatus TaxID=422442 RepID=A0A512CYX9_9MICO|nr:hypothetical protein [Terrabacter aerolatus]GEO29436.1 hypothetical protein TAE01_12460 [Terrabacter aerolatus]
MRYEGDPAEPAWMNGFTDLHTGHIECGECGSLVLKSDRAARLHQGWHANIEEDIERAARRD